VIEEINLATRNQRSIYAQELLLVSKGIAT
jgi:hypothetical protein